MAADHERTRDLMKLWKSEHDRVQAENEALRAAIERHRQVCRLPEGRDVYPHDRAVDLDLWSVLDDR